MMNSTHEVAAMTWQTHMLRLTLAAALLIVKIVD